MAQSYNGAHSCSTLYVFSTQLANRAAQAVGCQQFPNIIEFHRSQLETRKILSLNPPTVKSAKAVNNDEAKKRSTPIEGAEPSLATASPNYASTSKEDGVKIDQARNAERELSWPEQNISSSENCENANEGESRKLMFVESPLEKMARLTQEALPFDRPPMKQAKIASPNERAKFVDEQLTPAQRQHRQEALQRIEDLKNFFGMSHQHQQSAMAVGAPNALGNQQHLPSYCVGDGKSMTVASPVSSTGQPNVVVTARSEQQHVEAQLQWQQLVAEHEANKQIVHPSPMASSSSAPGGPGDPAFLRPGTCMMVQGKPAVMVPPVASPRNPLRPSAPRPPAPEQFVNPTMNQGPPCGYDMPVQFNVGPRFMSTVNFRASGDTSSTVVMMGGGDRRVYGQEVGHVSEMAPYVSIPPEEGCSYIRAPPSYAQQQQQRQMSGEYVAVEGMKMVPAQGQCMGKQQQQPPFMVQAYDFDGQPGGNPAMGGVKPMVNNTYVNATMSIQQVNIQNVSPYPTTTGVITMPGRPPSRQLCPPNDNAYARLSGTIHHRPSGPPQQNSFPAVISQPGGPPVNYYYYY